MMTDDEFLAVLESGAAPRVTFRFGHREHLRLAWLYVRRDGTERGGTNVTTGIRRVAAAHGAPTKYHETITRFWVRLVAHHVAEDPSVDSFAEFLARNPLLADPRLPSRHYTRETVAGAAAREEWVEPDLAPLP